MQTTKILLPLLNDPKILEAQEDNQYQIVAQSSELFYIFKTDPDEKYIISPMKDNFKNYFEYITVMHDNNLIYFIAREILEGKEYKLITMLAVIAFEKDLQDKKLYNYTIQHKFSENYDFIYFIHTNLDLKQEYNIFLENLASFPPDERLEEVLKLSYWDPKKSFDNKFVELLSYILAPLNTQRITLNCFAEEVKEHIIELNSWMQMRPALERIAFSIGCLLYDNAYDYVDQFISATKPECKVSQRRCTIF